MCNVAHADVPNCLASCNFKLLKVVSSAWMSFAVSAPLRYCRSEKTNLDLITDMQHLLAIIGNTLRYFNTGKQK